MNKVMVEGHRGWCAKYPENTLVSYKAALELGVDVLEFDVWLTTDKVPVLMHDKSALRTCGVDKNLCEMTLAEVKELEPCYSDKFGDEYKGQGIEVPTLEELLKLCKEIRPDIILGVEIKQYEEETVDYTVELLKKYGFFDTCCFYAFHAPIIKYIKTKYNGKTMAYPDFRMKEWTPDTYDYYDELGIALVIAKSEIFPIYPKKGMKMHLYCADTTEDAQFCIDKGASFITVNDPIPLMKLLGRI